MSIYTKKGDRGKTSLFKRAGKKDTRVSKDSKIICAIGAVDELNSFLGIVLAFSRNKQLKKDLTLIQKNLLTIGSILAGSKLKLEEDETNNLEKSIDRYDREIVPLKNFIIPQGTKTASLLQYSRTLTRRAEREVVALSKNRQVKASVLKYLNRLSDYLYTLSRWINLKEGGKEDIWNPR
jgi:cob(I)alamin adenosyltransferase